MGAQSARVVSSRRPRWRAYLLLARVSNLPTVWTNVLAGMTVAGAPFSWSAFGRLSVAASLFYTGGMFLNDAFDSRIDAAIRPDRPIPQGEVTRAEAFIAGAAFLGAGELALAILQPFAAALLWGMLLCAAIVHYDYHHKQNPFGPLMMGTCRGLVYFVAAAGVSGSVSRRAGGAAILLACYIVGLTWVAKWAGPRPRWLVPLLLAGISVVDAGVVVFFGPAWLAGLAATGFVLTLILQRVVPGT